MTFYADLNRYLNDYDLSERDAEREREACPLDSYAAHGEQVRYVSESDLYGNPDERAVGHLVTYSDGYRRYVGGPHEPQW